MKRYPLFALVSALLFTGAAHAQYPMVDMFASNLVQKYQFATCEQLWEEKGKPKTPQQQEAIQMLRSNPQMRTYFIDKVAAPIVNKMFECGMIP